VDRLDADGTRVLGQESTNPPILSQLKNTPIQGPRSDSRRSTIIIMPATLHDHAPNTYYGQWLGKKALFPGLESPAIAHNEPAASAGFVAFDVPERDFPGNRPLPRWKFVSRPKRKICAPGEVAQRPRRSPLPSKQERSGVDLNDTFHDRASPGFAL
jgi:hypothetical protein